MYNASTCWNLGRSLRSDEGVFLSASCNKMIAGFDLVSLSHWHHSGSIEGCASTDHGWNTRGAPNMFLSCWSSLLFRDGWVKNCWEFNEKETDCLRLRVWGEKLHKKFMTFIAAISSFGFEVQDIDLVVWPRLSFRICRPGPFAHWRVVSLAPSYWSENHFDVLKSWIIRSWTHAQAGVRSKGRCVRGFWEIFV